MRKYLIITLAALTVCAGCTRKTRHFGTEGAGMQASCTYNGTDSTHAQWQFTNEDGSPLVAEYDSLRVIELGPEGHPATVCFHQGTRQLWFQFYSNMQKRSEGCMENGLREGMWTFYYPDGIKQTEYAFVGGKEEGRYKVFRENGFPYYIGQCHEGRRVGTWEVYDANGNLVTTKDYGD